MNPFGWRWLESIGYKKTEESSGYISYEKTIGNVVIYVQYHEYHWSNIVVMSASGVFNVFCGNNEYLTMDDVLYVEKRIGLTEVCE